eukprot:12017241-Alexandrium_andersonii.AAC.1
MTSAADETGLPVRPSAPGVAAPADARASSQTPAPAAGATNVKRAAAFRAKYRISWGSPEGYLQIPPLRV